MGIFKEMTYVVDGSKVRVATVVMLPEGSAPVGDELLPVTAERIDRFLDVARLVIANPDEYIGTTPDIA